MSHCAPEVAKDEHVETQMAINNLLVLHLKHPQAAVPLNGFSIFLNYNGHIVEYFLLNHVNPHAYLCHMEQQRRGLLALAVAPLYLLMMRYRRWH